MDRIVECAAVETTRHRYTVEGWGTGELWVAGRTVVEHSFDLRAAADAGARVPKGTPTSPENTVADERARVGDDFAPMLASRLAAVLDGAEDDLADVALDLRWCTPFQRAAIDTLREIPRGEVVTYGELAALAGRPGAARAAGSVCANNRFWLLVPCHRVVAAAGLGGYGSSGPGVKQRLLELEGVPVAAL